MGLGVSDIGKSEEWPPTNPTKPDKAPETYVRRWKVCANGTPKSDAATLADLCSRASASCSVEDIIRSAVVACMFDDVVGHRNFRGLIGIDAWRRTKTNYMPYLKVHRLFRCVSRARQEVSNAVAMLQPACATTICKS